MYEVHLSPDALKFYHQADRPLARQLNRCWERLEQEPRKQNNIKRLTGPFAGLLRFRIGDWRVIYRINETDRIVHVLQIRHRREVYE